VAGRMARWLAGWTSESTVFRVEILHHEVVQFTVYELRLIPANTHTQPQPPPLLLLLLQPLLLILRPLPSPPPLPRAQKGPGSNRIAALSRNNLRQTVHTHRASVHQVAKLVAALLRAWRKVMTVLGKLLTTKQQNW